MKKEEEEEVITSLDQAQSKILIDGIRLTIDYIQCGNKTGRIL
jgi:hypothetical protein